MRTVLRNAILARKFSPYRLPGLWADHDWTDIGALFQDSAATTPVAADADPIGYVRDKSGNGRNLTQATANRRPGYKVNIAGARSAAFCSNGGDADAMNTTDTIAPSDMSVMCVIKAPGTITGGTTYGFFSASNVTTPNGMHMYINTSGQFVLEVRPTLNALATGVSVTASGLYIIGATVKNTGVTRTMFVNGTIYTNSTAVTATSEIVTLARHNNDSFNNWWTGYLLRNIIYNQAQTDSNMLALTDYLNREWGVF